MGPLSERGRLIQEYEAYLKEKLGESAYQRYLKEKNAERPAQPAR